MIKANFNAYNTYVTDSLYQWDINQVLKVTGLNLEVIPEVHFSNHNMSRAIVRQATLENNIVSVTIPNSLLQAPLKIYAYIGIYDGDTFKCIETVEIPIMPRKKPEDYIIEDTDEEIYSFKALENRLDNVIADIQKNNEEFVENIRNQNEEFIGEANDLIDSLNETKEDFETILSNKANKTHIVKSTLYADRWSKDIYVYDNAYSFESTYPYQRYNIEIALDCTATEQQFNAFNSAQIVGSATRNIIKAYGEMPTIDIPIIVKVVEV